MVFGAKLIKKIIQGGWMTDSFLDFNANNWESFKKDLKKIVGDTAYNNWLKKLGFLSLS